jgi:hypothetical protein
LGLLILAWADSAYLASSLAAYSFEDREKKKKSFEKRSFEDRKKKERMLAR